MLTSKLNLGEEKEGGDECSKIVVNVLKDGIKTVVFEIEEGTSVRHTRERNIRMWQNEEIKEKI